MKGLEEETKWKIPFVTPRRGKNRSNNPRIRRMEESLERTDLLLNLK